MAANAATTYYVSQSSGNDASDGKIAGHGLEDAGQGVGGRLTPPATRSS